MDNRFKVWDVKCNQWMTDGFIIDSNGRLFKFIRGFERRIIVCGSERFKIAWCTGLKNVADELVYVGDVVSDDEYTGVVHWDTIKGAWCWRLGKYLNVIVGQTKTSGNIYENPKYRTETHDG